MLLLCFTMILTYKLSYVNNKMKRGVNMSGAEIKERILAADLRVWQVADAFGCTDGNFSRKLRKDFSDADTDRVLSIIDKLKAEQ